MWSCSWSSSSSTPSTRRSATKLRVAMFALVLFSTIGLSFLNFERLFSNIDRRRNQRPETVGTVVKYVDFVEEGHVYVVPVVQYECVTFGNNTTTQTFRIETKAWKNEDDPNLVSSYPIGTKVDVICNRDRLGGTIAWNIVELILGLLFGGYACYLLEEPRGGGDDDDDARSTDDTVLSKDDQSSSEYDTSNISSVVEIPLGSTDAVTSVESNPSSDESD